MEKKILFVGLREIYSTKKEKTYYQVQYVADKQCVIEFVSEETYATLKTIKLNYLGEYIGIFNFNASTRKVELANIKA